MRCPYELTYEAGQKILRVKCGPCQRLGSLHDGGCREGIISALAAERNVWEVVLEREREYYFDADDTGVLSEYAAAWTKAKGALEGVGRLRGKKRRCDTCAAKRVELAQTLAQELLRDWAFGHRLLVKTAEGEREAKVDEGCRACQREYVELLSSVAEGLAGSKIIVAAKGASNDDVRIGTVYDALLSMKWRPFFIKSKLLPDVPEDAILKDVFEGELCRWKVHYVPSQAGYFLYAETPEASLNLLEVDILRSVQRYMQRGEIEAILRSSEPQQALSFLRDLARRVILEEIRGRGLEAELETVEKLADIFAVYFGDLGILRRLIDCPGVTTVQVLHPPDTTTVKVEHERYGQMETGIIVHTSELLRMVSRMRYYTKRPFSKSSPFLDCDYMGLRISAACHPAIYEPDTLGMTIAKPRARPWTQPLFIEKKQLNLLASALASSILSMGRGASVVVLGPPGAGKTSTLESLLIECPTIWNYHIIEDVRELHLDVLQKLGYSITEYAVRPDLLEKSEHALEPLAGDTVIHSARRRPYVYVLNEVRSETVYKVLSRIQGMTGTLSMSTLFARSVEDLWRQVRYAWGSPPDQFKQFDLVLQLSSFKPELAGGQIRRLTEIVEVRKDFKEDPVREGGFKRLMVYDPRADTLLPTKDFLEGPKPLMKRLCSASWDGLDAFEVAGKLSLSDSSPLLSFAAWSANLGADELLEYILVNGKLKSDILALSGAADDGSRLECEFVSTAYKRWRDILTRQSELHSTPELDAAYREFKAWLKSVS